MCIYKFSESSSLKPLYYYVVFLSTYFSKNVDFFSLMFYNVYEVNKMYKKNNIHKNIRNRRLELGWSQSKLAELMGYTDRSSISKLEGGNVDISLTKIIEMSKILNISPLELMGIENNEVKEYEENKNNIKIPYVNTYVSAGIPSSVDACYEYKLYDIPDFFLGKYKSNKDLMILRVNGESMNKIIPDGSYIIISKDLSKLKNGDIVVFNSEYDYSLKYYYDIGDEVLFKPYSYDDSFHEMRYSKNDSIKIEGIVVSYISVL